MESPHGDSERTADGNGFFSWRYNEHSPDSEGVFSWQYSKHPADGEGAISWRESERIARDSCAHKPQIV